MHHNCESYSVHNMSIINVLVNFSSISKRSMGISQTLVPSIRVDWLIVDCATRSQQGLQRIQALNPREKQKKKKKKHYVMERMTSGLIRRRGKRASFSPRWTLGMNVLGETAAHSLGIAQNW